MAGVTVTVTDNSGYQRLSPWPQYRGPSNTNRGQSLFYGPTEKPSIIWQFYRESTFVYGAPAIAADGTIYISLNISMYALTSGGSVKWSFEANARIDSSAAIGLDGEIYFGTDHFYCLSSSGGLKWNISNISTTYSRPLITADRTIYFLDRSGVLYAVDPNGGLLWKYKIGDVTNSSPAANSNGTVYVGSFDTYLHAITSSGSLYWRYKTSDYIRSTPAIGYDGTVYIGVNKYVYALSSEGTRLWQRAVGGNLFYNCPAVSNDGLMIYVSGYTTEFYALTASTGSVFWRYSVDALILASAVIGADGTIYMGSADNNLYSLTSKGSLLWKFNTDGAVTSSPVIGADSLIYTVNAQGHFFALSGSSAVSPTSRPTLSSISTSSSVVPSLSPAFAPSSISISPVLNFSLSPTSSTYTLSSSRIGYGEITGIVLGAVAFFLCAFIISYRFTDAFKQKSPDFSKDSDRNIYIDKLMRDSMLPSSDQRLIRIPVAKSTPSTIEPTIIVDHSNRTKIGSKYGYIHSRPVGSTKFITSSASSTSLETFVPGISWFDIDLKSDNLKDVVIGQGSFGKVILATLKTKSPDGTTLITEDDVVVKVLTKSLLATRDAGSALKLLNTAIEEVSVLLNTESKILYKDCIVKAFGVAAGHLPSHMCQVMNVADDAEVVGIVMRYEEGGSLDAVIHPKSKSSKEVAPALTMKDKLFLLTGIAREIAELHSAGIVHGDIKPDNILLSSKSFCKAEVRLSDFGLAAIGEESSALHSSLKQTAHTRGTPLYCAPEMLVNLYDENFNEKVAKASTKTDVYAFAILAWEVLTEKRPFTDIKSEMVLCAKVHQGARPPIKDVPSTCPHQIVHMITSCWDADRSKRRTAVECFCTLKHYHGLMVNAVYDVYLICHSSKQALSDYIYNRLTQRGLNVLFINKNEQICQTLVGMDSDTVTDDEEKTYMNDVISTSSTYASDIIGGMCSSQVIVVCIDQAFQENESCLFEIKEARKLKPPRPIVPLFLDANQTAWLNDAMKYHCRLGDTSTQTFNISESASDESWLSDEGPNAETIASLNAEMDALSDYIRQQFIVTSYVNDL